MPGPLDPRTDKWMRVLLLDHLKRDLMYVKFEALDLVHFQPLRDEVEAELKSLMTLEQKELNSAE